jgi:hypothetical protein
LQLHVECTSVTRILWSRNGGGQILRMYKTYVETEDLDSWRS